MSILDSDEHGRTVLIFVNKSHGSYSSTNKSNDFVVVFSKNTDVQFSEFIGLSPTNVCINGSPGFYCSTPGWNKVRWMDGDIERWIEGSFDEDTLIRIAESLIYLHHKTWEKAYIGPIVRWCQGQYLRK